MPSSSLFLRSSTTLISILSLFSPASAAPALNEHVARQSKPYTLQKEYSGSSFFDQFYFFDYADPTHGYVTYGDRNYAQQNNLISYDGTYNYMKVDSTTRLTKTTGYYNNNNIGRKSVRLEGTYKFTHGLIITDIAHMPSGICGTWPAFWTLGDDWPNNGEIDIIEGANAQGPNWSSLHTNHPSEISPDEQMTGSVPDGQTDCNVDLSAPRPNYTGCKVVDSSSSTFSNYRGGVWAMEWTSDAIKVWYWSGKVPDDVTAGTPNPAGWGTPRANFGPKDKLNADANFKDNHIIFDTTFCGDLGDATWASTGCAARTGYDSCAKYVANVPSAFADAYWKVKYVKIYQNNGVTTSSTTSSQSSTTSSKSSTTSSVSTTASSSSTTKSTTASTTVSSSSTTASSSSTTKSTTASTTASSTTSSVSSSTTSKSTTASSSSTTISSSSTTKSTTASTSASTSASSATSSSTSKSTTASSSSTTGSTTASTSKSTTASSSTTSASTSKSTTASSSTTSASTSKSTTASSSTTSASTSKSTTASSSTTSASTGKATTTPLITSSTTSKTTSFTTTKSTTTGRPRRGRFNIQVDLSGKNKRAGSYLKFDGVSAKITDDAAEASEFSIEDGYLMYGEEYVVLTGKQGYSTFSKTSTKPSQPGQWSSDGGSIKYDAGQGFCVKDDNTMVAIIKSKPPFECRTASLGEKDVGSGGSTPSTTTSSTTKDGSGPSTTKGGSSPSTTSDNGTKSTTTTGKYPASTTRAEWEIVTGGSKATPVAGGFYPGKGKDGKKNDYNKGYDYYGKKSNGDYNADCDNNGYDFYGYDEDHKYNKDYDNKGYDHWGFNKDGEYDEECDKFPYNGGYDFNGKDKSGKYSSDCDNKGYDYRGYKNGAYNKDYDNKGYDHYGYSDDGEYNADYAKYKHKYNKPSKSGVTITLTETYKVPCSTGWETKTKTIYTTHCGCTETPVPTKPVYSTYTTECPESWGVGKTVTVTVPYGTWTPEPEAATTWAAYPAPSAKPTDTWSNLPVVSVTVQPKPVDAASTWAAWASASVPTTTAKVPAASTGAGEWNNWNGAGKPAATTGPVKVWQGAATSNFVNVNAVIALVAGVVLLM